MDINAAAYTDLNSLNQIKKIGKEDEAAGLKKVSQQFESFFLKMMMKSMRDANKVFAEGNPMNSNEMEFHQDMLDQQLSLSLSQNGHGIGLAKVLERQLAKQYHIGGDRKIAPLNKSIPLSGNEMHVEKVEKKATVKESAEAKMDFEHPVHFVKTLYAYAKEAAEKIGVTAEVLLSQAALETGWGKHIMEGKEGSSSYNLFGIKADRYWQGETVDKASVEYEDGIVKKIVSPFRSYEGFKQSFEDYVKFIQGNPRYQQALKVAGDARAFTRALQEAGYATDPEYAEKIMGILDSNVFKQAIRG